MSAHAHRKARTRRQDNHNFIASARFFIVVSCWRISPFHTRRHEITIIERADTIKNEAPTR